HRSHSHSYRLSCQHPSPPHSVMTISRALRLLNGSRLTLGNSVFDARGVASIGIGAARRSSGEAAFLLDEADDLVGAVSPSQIGEYERTGPAHSLGIAIHDLQRGPDVRRQ